MQSSRYINKREHGLKFGFEPFGSVHFAFTPYGGGEMAPQSHSVLSEHNAHSILIAFYSLHFY